MDHVKLHRSKTFTAPALEKDSNWNSWNWDELFKNSNTVYETNSYQKGENELRSTRAARRPSLKNSSIGKVPRMEKEFKDIDHSNLKRCVTFRLPQSKDLVGDGSVRGGSDHLWMRKQAGVSSDPPFLLKRHNSDLSVKSADSDSSSPVPIDLNKAFPSTMFQIPSPPRESNPDTTTNTAQTSSPSPSSPSSKMSQKQNRNWANQPGANHVNSPMNYNNNNMNNNNKNKMFNEMNNMMNNVNLNYNPNIPQMEQLRNMQLAMQSQMMYWMQMQQAMFNQHQHMYQNQNVFPQPVQPRHQQYQQQQFKPRADNNNNNHSSGSNIRVLLQEHKERGKKPELSELLGHVVEFARDSHGSRFVQYKMETSQQEEKQLLIDELCLDSVSLMTNVFGNYVVQNFLQHGNSEQRHKLASTMKGSMMNLSTHQHGCRVVQSAFDLISPELRAELLEELIATKQNIITCARDIHATHVLQKAIKMLRRDKEDEDNSKRDLSKELVRLLELAIRDDLLQLSTDSHSCKLVQLVIGSNPEVFTNVVKETLKLVEKNYYFLSKDQNGNFILQHILNNFPKSDEHLNNVNEFIRENIFDLSQHKFGSHLVEKAITSANQGQANKFIQELLHPMGKNALRVSKGQGEVSQNESSGLIYLMKDLYANFVVQCAYNKSKDSLRNELSYTITKASDLLSKFTYGRHILNHVSSTS